MPAIQRSLGGAFFTHKGVTNNCASCHNGVAATGMPATQHPGRYAPDPVRGLSLDHQLHDLGRHAHQPSGRDGSDLPELP